MSLLYATDASLLKQYLEDGADPNVEDRFGFSAVHSAAYLCRPDLLKLLIDFGAAVDTRDIHGVTPLMVASEKGCRRAVEILLGNGAHPGSEDTHGETPLSRAVKGKYGEVLYVLAERLLKEGLLRKEESCDFPDGGSLVSFMSPRKNDPLIWSPVIGSNPDFHYCYLEVNRDSDSSSLVAVDLVGDSWYVFISGDEFIARRKE